MTVKHLLDDITTKLSSLYPQEEAKAIAYVLLEDIFGVKRHEVSLYPDKEIMPDERFGVMMEELLSHRPLQYVLGYTWFCDMKFNTREGVLIPRPETEELVEWIAAETNKPHPKILDIGTGSGAIAISLAKRIKGASVSALDVSTNALDIAIENAALNNTKVNFFLCDILKDFPEGVFDIIVSNPPYVTGSEKAAMRANVLEHEPHVALFVPDEDPLKFYRRIASYAVEHLVSGGKLYFEINENYGGETAGMLRDKGFTGIRIKKDIFDKDRMICAIKR